MKSWIYISLVVFGFTSCGRKIASNNLPEPVQTSFQNQFPMANNAEWKQSHNKYKVKFHNGNQYMYARYKEDGTLNKAMRQCTATCLESN